RRRQTAARARALSERLARMMFGRGVNISANAGDLVVFARGYFGHAEVGDLKRAVIGAEQEVVRLEVAVNDPLVVGVGQRLAGLFEIEERLFERQRIAWAGAAEFEQVAARHVFERQVIKRRAAQVGGGAVPPSQDHVRMAYGVERDGFVLEV